MFEIVTLVTFEDPKTERRLEVVHLVIKLDTLERFIIGSYYTRDV